MRRFITCEWYGSDDCDDCKCLLPMGLRVITKPALERRNLPHTSKFQTRVSAIGRDSLFLQARSTTAQTALLDSKEATPFAIESLQFAPSVVRVSHSLHSVSKGFERFSTQPLNLFFVLCFCCFQEGSSP